ncbi:SIMPL domain-containing protein [Allomuricauda sp. d1]|uniref:SIMPL domain-containing protein n=1 Tax=Allomuricauda sp. d1 TaxID=3136725 RepID=UPI0031DF0CFB
MKKIALIIIALVHFGVNAQNQPNSKTLTVTGKAKVEREISAYRGRATLSMDQLYYSDPSCNSLEQLKERYFDALQEAGVDTGKFTEDKSEFLSYGYQQDGTVLIYETESNDEIRKLFKVRIPGVSLAYEYKSELSEADKKSALKAAFDDANKKAKELSEVTEIELGSILSISDYSPESVIWNTYRKYDEYLTLTVVYTLK